MIIKLSELHTRKAEKIAIEEFESHTIAIYKIRPNEDQVVVSKLELLELLGFAKGIKEDFIVDVTTLDNQLDEFSMTPYFRAFLKRCLEEDIDLLLLVRE